MMKNKLTRYRSEILLGGLLVLLSLAVYLAHYLLFRDSHHIFIFLVSDLAFVFIEVLLVTVIIHRTLNEREKNIRLEKLNMVIGSFFSELGTRLLTVLSDLDPACGELRARLVMDNGWGRADYARQKKLLPAHAYQVRLGAGELEDLKDMLCRRGEFLLGVLNNPMLLEHELFTDLMRAVFHLSEELSVRPELDGLPEHDMLHLEGDARRAYRLLAAQWLDYMLYLRENYPYLFSLAARLNPFDLAASPVIP